MDRPANLLGALALAVSDRQREAVVAVAGDESSAAALSALLHFLEAPSIDLLRQVLGLTHSGTVRLLDRLEHQRLVSRRPGPDGRTAAVHLTPAGREAAEAVTSARGAVLDGVLAPLSSAERSALDALVGRALAGMVRQPGATRWTCRMCDTEACGRPRGECPVANEAERRHGPLPG